MLISVGCPNRAVRSYMLRFFETSCFVAVNHVHILRRSGICVLMYSMFQSFCRRAISFPSYPSPDLAVKPSSFDDLHHFPHQGFPSQSSHSHLIPPARPHLHSNSKLDSNSSQPWAQPSVPTVPSSMCSYTPVHLYPYYHRFHHSF